jgi:hypothetical protein
MFHVFMFREPVLLVSLPSNYNSSIMDLNSTETHDLLRQAREKAEKLVRELHARKAEVEANPPDLPIDQLAQGRIALDNAIASAERMLKSLDDAQRIASVETN